jgi:hypothetical protein
MLWNQREYFTTVPCNDESIDVQTSQQLEECKKKRHYYFKYFSTNFRCRSVGYLIDILYADHIEKKQSFK